jgi:hypothetical protein
MLDPARCTRAQPAAPQFLRLRARSAVRKNPGSLEKKSEPIFGARQVQAERVPDLPRNGQIRFFCKRERRRIYFFVPPRRAAAWFFRSSVPMRCAWAVAFDWVSATTLQHD